MYSVLLLVFTADQQKSEQWMMHEFYTAYSFLVKFACDLIFCLQSVHIYKFHLMLETNSIYFPSGLHLSKCHCLLWGMKQIFKYLVSKIPTSYIYTLTFTNVTEYLKYKTCYRGVSKDWDACASRFVQLVREEMNRKNATEASRLMELCWSVSRIFCVHVKNQSCYSSWGIPYNH